nr:MAG TPA: hypothetical protein [Caudoviricetes sp.]
MYCFLLAPQYSPPRQNYTTNSRNKQARNVPACPQGMTALR